MTPDILLRFGNRAPLLQRVLEVDGIVLDLTDATEVRFKASGASGVVISGTCTMATDRTTGEVTYAWSAQDALVPAGFYQCWFEVDFPGSVGLTLPNATYLVLQITALLQGTWSYSGDPSSSDRDAVRYYLGDTDPDDPLVSDGEIDFLLAEWLPVSNSKLIVAAVAAENLASRYAREVAVSADGVTVALQDLMDRFLALSGRLRSQDAQRNIGGPDVGGVDLNDVYDPSVKPLNFSVGMHDNYRGGGQGDYRGDEYYGGVW